MQRYFLKTIDQDNKIAVLKDNDFHHIKNVMRHKLNDQIIVCDLEENCFISTITEITTNEVHVSLNDKVPSNELPLSVDLAQGLIRREKFEYVLQKATELGVKNIIPVNSKYSIIHTDQKKLHKKVERWNKITKEASEQSHRSFKVNVTTPLKSFNEINYNKYDKVIVAYEKENQSKELHSSFDKLDKKILLIIGPEGGLHETEIESFSKLDNVHFVGLGKRILRSETASTYLLSVISYLYEIGDLS